MENQFVRDWVALSKFVATDVPNSKKWKLFDTFSKLAVSKSVNKSKSKKEILETLFTESVCLERD